LGRSDEAGDVFERLVDRFPTTEWARYSVERLQSLGEPT
jgi:outer membrane protein assembly factor BamD (BamD/ComL family)